MFCSKCGAQIADDSAFCTQCGAKTSHVHRENIQETQQANYIQEDQPQQQQMYQQPYQQPYMQQASAKNTSTIPRVMSVIGAIMAAIGCFLPFYSISAMGYSDYKTYADGDGVLVIVLAAVTLVLCIISRKVIYKFSVISSGLSLAIYIYTWMQIKDMENQYGIIGNFASFDVGAYLVAAGCGLMVVGGLIGLFCKVPKKNVPM